MELIIDVDKIKDPTKREWLISSLKLMQIDYQTKEQPEDVAEYNKDLEKGDSEIERGEFVSATDLKAEANSWS